MTPAIVVFIYLAVVLYIGIFAFRKGRASREDYFLAGRSLGPYVFLLDTVRSPDRLDLTIDDASWSGNRVASPSPK